MEVTNEISEEALLLHLDAAYNLARWLTRNERDAEDVVQEAYLRALKHFGTFKGGDVRPWLLKIVRNTFYTSIRRNRLTDAMTPFEEEEDIHVSDAPSPEMLLVQEANQRLVRRALQQLPRHFLEVILLREFEELSYQQIADTVQIPVGTVMSRLARARGRLAQIISNCHEGVASVELAL
jgi:RNA polymerase sigma factor (sigma-70 family)